MDASTACKQQRSVQHFPLVKYCRMKQNPSTELGSNSYANSKEKWITYEVSGNTRMQVSISSAGHVIVTRGNMVLESFYVAMGSEQYTSSKAYQKKDVVIVLYKVKEEARMFRLQFRSTETSSAEEVATSCASTLSKYMPLRLEGGSKSDPQPAQGGATETSLAAIATDLMNKTHDHLPMLYQQCNFACSENDERELNEFVRLCISDPTFPSYVGKIEEILKGIVTSKGDE